MFNQVRLIYKRMGKEKDKDKLKAVPNVVFEGEVGSDAGGPSREFFYLALTCCTGEIEGGSILFTGQANHLVPVHDWDLLEDGNFFLVGKMLAHSLIHGGCGFVGMSQGIVKYIETEDVDIAAASITIEDIPDVEVQSLAGKVIESSNDDISKLWKNNSLLLDILDQAGVQKLDAKNKEKAVQQIMLHQVLLKRKYEVDDIIKGLNTLSLAQLLKRHPCVSQLVFPTLSDVIVPRALVLDMLTLDSEEPFPLEPNKQRAYGYLQHYVKDCEERNTLPGNTTFMIHLHVLHKLLPGTCMLLNR